MNAFIAPVVAQSAITNPTMVITTLVAGWSFRRCRLSLRSVTVFFRCDLAEVLHEIADRVWAGNEGEQAGRDQ
jgi:hypothetical protein